MSRSKNRDFVQSVGCCDPTLNYDVLGEVIRHGSTIYVDFSGDEALRARVHFHFGDAFACDCFLGLTSSKDLLKDDPSLPGRKPVFFFVATQIKKRKADWGRRR